MKSDESFEHEVRATLVASATGRAPDALAARIGQIPDREPMPRAGAGRLHLAGRVAVNLAAAAVVILLVVVGFIAVSLLLAVFSLTSALKI